MTTTAKPVEGAEVIDPKQFAIRLAGNGRGQELPVIEAAIKSRDAAVRALALEEAAVLLENKAIALDAMKEHSADAGDTLSAAVALEWRCAMVDASRSIRSLNVKG